MALIKKERHHWYFRRNFVKLFWMAVTEQKIKFSMNHFFRKFAQILKN